MGGSNEQSEVQSLREKVAWYSDRDRGLVASLKSETKARFMAEDEVASLRVQLAEATARAERAEQEYEVQLARADDAVDDMRAMELERDAARDEGRREGRAQGYAAVARESWDHWLERAAALLDLVLDRIAPGAVAGEEPEHSATVMAERLIDLRNSFARAAAGEAEAPRDWPKAVEDRRRVTALRRERTALLPDGYCGSIHQAAHEAYPHRVPADERAARTPASPKAAPEPANPWDLPEHPAVASARDVYEGDERVQAALGYVHSFMVHDKVGRDMQRAAAPLQGEPDADVRRACGCVMGVRRVCVEHCGGHAIPQPIPVAPTAPQATEADLCAAASAYAQACSAPSGRTGEARERLVEVARAFAAAPQGPTTDLRWLREGLSDWANRLLTDRSNESVEAAVRALWLYRDVLDGSPRAPQGPERAALGLNDKGGPSHG